MANEENKRNLRSISKFSSYIIDGKFKNCGYQIWKDVFSGISKTTGKESVFFVEYYLVNPFLSPKEVSFSSSSSVPSYLMVKAGIYGENPKQFNVFFPSEKFVWDKKEKTIKCGNCFLDQDTSSGSIYVSEENLLRHPELCCNSGKIEWKLKFEKSISFLNSEKTFNEVWAPHGLKTIYVGSVRLDGEEYSISPRSSFGYSDKSWATSNPKKHFHVSTSNITSLITGNHLSNSAFVMRGEFSDRVKLLLNLEGKKIEILKPRMLSKYSEIHDFIESPKDSDEQKLHWSGSFHQGKLIVDIDAYCLCNEMLVKEYETTSLPGKKFKNLSGGTGTGEIRIYQKFGKNIVLLEHASFANAHCEFGQIE